MKKLISLSFFLPFLILLFAGCQNSDELTSPVDLDKKQPIEIPDAVNEVAGELTEIDLVAGGTTVCGHITVVQIENRTLEIWFYADPGWTIMETHAAAGAYPSYLPVDETTGYPLMGYFEHNAFYEDGVIVAGPCYVTIPNTANWSRMVYVGAHAIVKDCRGEAVTANICPEDFPDQATILTLTPETDYYLKLEFDQPIIDEENEFFGWCIDNTRWISTGTINLPVNFICSYDNNIDACIVNKSYNLGKANWIINHKEINGWAMADVQAALWSLLSDGTDWLTKWVYDADNLSEILQAAESHANWEPTECDQKVLVVVYQSGFNDPCLIENQVLAIEVPVQCEEIPCSDDIIAWAFNVTVDGSGNLVPDGTSALYTSRYWYRFFGYLAY